MNRVSRNVVTVLQVPVIFTLSRFSTTSGVMKKKKNGFGRPPKYEKNGMQKISFFSHIMVCDVFCVRIVHISSCVDKGSR